MADEMARGAVMLRLEAVSDRFDPVDGRWQSQVEALLTGLPDEAQVVREMAPAPGSKGGIESVVLALVSADVVVGVLQVVQAWITRDRSRSVALSWHADGTWQRVEVRGDDLESTVRHVLPVLVEQLGKAD